MVKRIMYQKIQYFRQKGYTKTEIMKETGLDKKTVRKYYDMTERKYQKYLERVRYRTKGFETYKAGIMEVYRMNGFKEVERSAVYDYMEETYGAMPGTERSFRNYIMYLVETGQLEFKRSGRIYYPVEDMPFGKQMQVDFGEERMKSGLKLYIFAAVLSASRYKYCAFQEKPFTTLEVIGHLLDCFE